MKKDFRTKLHEKHIRYILKILERTFDECDTLKEWEAQCESIYYSMCSFPYDTFKKLKEYAGV